MFTIEMLDAYEGDALWITYGDPADPSHVLIDAGRKRTYREIAGRIEALGKPLELFVITHVDDDHIFGAIPLLADGRIRKDRFKDIWYNGYTHLDPDVGCRPPSDVLGPKNGEVFAGLLLQGEFPWNEGFDQGNSVVIEDDGPLPAKTLGGGMKLTLLSPTWQALKALKRFWERELDDMEPGDVEAALKIFSEAARLQPDVLGDKIDIQGILDFDVEEADTKEPNGSSIAFLAEFGDDRVLFTGDAHPPELERSIDRLLAERGGGNRLKIDALKVSHHGSKSNTTTSLLNKLDCSTFLISTNGSRHHHPDREALARIVARNRDEPEPTNLYFNHLSDETRRWENDEAKEEWNYQTFYPPEGRKLTLCAN